MQLVKYCAILSLSFCLLGCGDATPSVTVEPPSATQQIKDAFDQVAASGEVDSGLVTAREQLEALKETDAAKAAELLKDLDELQAMKDATAIKKKASEMAAKL